MDGQPLVPAPGEADVPAETPEQKEDRRRYYIGDKKVKGIRETGSFTPTKRLPIVEILYNDDSKELIPRLRYDVMHTQKASDASTARKALVKYLGAVLFSEMLELDLRRDEINPVLDEVVRLCDAAADRASNILFGVEHADDRTLLRINDVLQTHYGKPQQPSNDAATPEGGVADQQDPV